jgi:hypothetical protein
MKDRLETEILKLVAETSADMARDIAAAAREAADKPGVREMAGDVALRALS